MSSSRGLIDFAALEKELRGSVQSEEKYRRENAAKLRAVDQRVGSYDEFRSLVLASHLKPLERHDQQGAPRKQPWNPVTAGNRTHHTVAASNRTHRTVTAGNGTHDTVAAGNGTEPMTPGSQEGNEENQK